MEKIIGRREEIQLLEETLKAKGSGLVAVYRRRRVGKTFLIHTNFRDRLAFELTDMYGASSKEQLQQFSKAMQRTGSVLSLKSPEDWVEAFHALEQYLEEKNKVKKWVVFSWMSFRGWMAANRDFCQPLFLS